MSAEMATFLVTFGLLGAFAHLLKRWFVEPLALWLLDALRVLAGLMILAGVVQWGTGIPLSRAMEIIRVGLNTTLATIAGVPVTPVSLLSLVVIIAGTWVASLSVQRGVQSALTSRGIGDPGTAAALARLVSYGVMAVGFGVGLELVGIDLGAFFAAGAVFAVGLGFAMQTIAENFVAGVILLVERTIRPGDILEVDGEMVRVVHLGIRSTLARNLDDEELILPNALLVQNPVKNLKLTDNLLRVRVAVGVAHETHLPSAMEALTRAARSVDAASERKGPVVVLTAFGSSSIDFEVSVWTDDPWTRPLVASALSMAIWAELERAGIVIAFPQLDLHLDDRVLRAIGEAAARRTESA